MGCCSSTPKDNAGKPAEPPRKETDSQTDDTAGCADNGDTRGAACDVALAPAVPAPAPKESRTAEKKSRSSTISCPPDMLSEAPAELTKRLHEGPSSERQTIELVAAIAIQCQRSLQHRLDYGDTGAVPALAELLVGTATQRVLAAAQTLKMLSMCHQNHRAFTAKLEVVPALIAALSHEELGVVVYALNTLCNLSATPGIITAHATDKALLAALKRVLTSTPTFEPTQNCAAQLLLNLTAPPAAPAYLAPERVPDELTIDSQPTCNTRDTREGSVMHTTPNVTNMSMSSEGATSSGYVNFLTSIRGYEIYAGINEPEALLGVLLDVLKNETTKLEREARDLCLEAVCALLDSYPKTRPLFVSSRGLQAVLNQVKVKDAMLSTLVHVCEILCILAEQHAAAMFRCTVVQAVGFLLSPLPKRNLDERRFDTDVKLAALQLTRELHGHALPAQQLQLAHEVVQHLPFCIGMSALSVQLSACNVLLMFDANTNSRPALLNVELAGPLVALAKSDNPLVASPSVQALGRLCDLSSAHADAVVRARGLDAMMSALEGESPAQAQRHALVSITKVLQCAPPSSLSPEVQRGRMVSLAANVMWTTAEIRAANHEQWLAWCCKVLQLAAHVDSACATKVVSMLSKTPDHLRLIGISPSAAKHDKVLAALNDFAARCSPAFLAKISNLQAFEEAVAFGLVNGRHVALVQGKNSPSLTVEWPQRRQPRSEGQRSGSHDAGTSVGSPVQAQGYGGNMLARGLLADTTRDTLNNNTYVSNITALGSTMIANTKDLGDTHVSQQTTQLSHMFAVAGVSQSQPQLASGTQGYTGAGDAVVAVSMSSASQGRSRAASPMTVKPENVQLLESVSANDATDTTPACDISDGDGAIGKVHTA